VLHSHLEKGAHTCRMLVCHMPHAPAAAHMQLAMHMHMHAICPPGIFTCPVVPRPLLYASAALHPVHTILSSSASTAIPVPGGVHILVEAMLILI
jgi:hypothetical protein